jgi:cytochrome c biogenesis protein
MSSIEQIVTTGAAVQTAEKRSGESFLTRFLKLICSVRLGVILLILLGLACFIGMIIMQQSVEGFERYFLELTPAQRLVYGKMGLFDIYHAWYFNALLAILSLNIILASIDRFPKTWPFLSKPNITVPVRWLRDQQQNAEVEFAGAADQVKLRITLAMKNNGWRDIRTADKGGQTFILGQSGTWNRFGAYAVHVGLLTIFVGGFMTGQLGSTGQMPVKLGETTNIMYETVVNLDKTTQVTARIPFQIACTDMQQKLIKKDGGLSAMNTIDWITRFTITDETGTHDAMVQMNRPFDYRGYRFFQASFIPIGRARTITVTVKPEDGGATQAVTIPRDGSAILADGTTLKFDEFRGDFKIGKEDPDENTSDYPNPAAVLKVTQPGGAPQTAYAFGPKMAGMPVAGKPIGGYTYQLTDFEKVADQHILSVQRDPGTTVVYVGFILLCLTLIAVFFFSHQRVWAAVETLGETHNVVLGGNTNRSLNAFDEKFRRFSADLAS